MAVYKKTSFLQNAEYRDNQFMDVNVGMPSIGKSISDETFVITPTSGLIIFDKSPISPFLSIPISKTP